MSIYGHLCCRDCKEFFHVKDESFSHLSVDPRDMGEFLEKHMEHRLIYIRDEPEAKTETGDENENQTEHQRELHTPPSLISSMIANEQRYKVMPAPKGNKFAQREGPKMKTETKGEEMKPTRKEYEESLNELGIPFEDLESEGGRIPDDKEYGSWTRRYDPIAFNVGYQDWAREHFE